MEQLGWYYYDGIIDSSGTVIVGFENGKSYVFRVFLSDEYGNRNEGVFIEASLPELHYVRYYTTYSNVNPVQVAWDEYFENESFIILYNTGIPIGIYLLSMNYFSCMKTRQFYPI